MKHNTIGKGKTNRAVNGGGDDYFTKPQVAEECVKSLIKYVTDGRRNIKSRSFIEPSAGAGAFIKPFDDTEFSVTGYDLTPRDKRITESNWFDVQLSGGEIVVGNPPFGFAASLAVKFFNHAASENASIIAFIVPRSFQKRSVKDKLNVFYHLVEEKILREDAFEMPDGTAYSVPCVWQIWQRKETKRKPAPKPINRWFEFTMPRHADFCVRRVGGRAGQVLAGLDHSSSSTYYLRALVGIDSHALAADISKLDLKEIVNSTVGVRSLSKGELILALHNYYLTH